jgi:hypothetical protein
MYIIRATRKYNGNTRAIFYFGAKEKLIKKKVVMDNCIEITKSKHPLSRSTSTFWIIFFSCKLTAFCLTETTTFSLNYVTPQSK